MVFRTRNSLYLRISEKAVLPLYLYLDARHIDWMSDVILQHVLSDLRPQILPKLQAESMTGLQGPATKKASTVETHRGESYQFCYFIRNVEPHSVLIKSRRFVAAAPRNAVVLHAPMPSKHFRRAKRKTAPTVQHSRAPAPRKKLKWKSKQPPSGIANDAAMSQSDDEDDIYISDSDEEVEMEGDLEEKNTNGRDVLEIEVDEEEKPKPLLQLDYKGFGVYATSNTRVNSAQPRTAIGRGETPLFLPDEMEQPEFPDVPLYTMDDQDSDDDDDPFSNLTAFSQVLTNVGDNRPGAAADDEDMDTAALFGDADEARRL